MIWFSGASRSNGRGAVMVYLPTRDSYWTWYAGFSGSGALRPTELKDTSNAELSKLLGAWASPPW